MCPLAQSAAYGPSAVEGVEGVDSAAAGESFDGSSATSDNDTAPAGLLDG